jgi:signal transduction histidine kinase
MPDGLNRIRRGVSFRIQCALAWWLIASTFPAGAQPVTNVQQLTQALSSERRLYCDVDLHVTVCAASRPKIGALIVQDESGVELLEVGNFGREIVSGDRLRLRGWHCLLRKRDLGIEITAGPVVDNDGIHVRRTWGGEANLRPGQNPIRLDWFNNLRELSLEVTTLKSNQPPQGVDPTNLWHAVVDESGHTNFLPGLLAECYEGYWESVPDFDLLQPVKTGVVTNFDLAFRTRDEMVGIRYIGYFNAPESGRYLFRTRSDDGSLLFLGKPELPLSKMGVASVPAATRAVFGEMMSHLTDRCWTTVEGRVDFISWTGAGLEFELCSDRDVISVRMADAAGLDVSRLQGAQVRVTGVGRAVLTADQRIILGRVSVASARDIALVEKAPDGQSPVPLAPIAQVQGLPLEEARRALPVRVRGMVTDAKNSFYNRWMSIQDDTRGIFVSLGSITNAAPAIGEFWEVQGHSGAGDFAPVLAADRITLLGDGRLPEPARPTWTELLNGSMDVQWAELHGLVTDVQSNILTLLLPEGRLAVQLDEHFEPELKAFDKTIVRIRGVLYAVWNAQTREVRAGSVLMRNATIVVETAAPADPFDVVLKTPRELLLFDAQATAFRRVKVRGQIIYADTTRTFLEEDGAGLQLLPVDKTQVRAGDLVEAVGYPDVRRTAVLLREVILRKTGDAALPAARKTPESELTRPGLDSTRVRVEGKLLGWHSEQNAPVLEMQSGTHLYLARLAPGNDRQLFLRPGSRLALEGVYVGRGRQPYSNPGDEGFELLLNSPADIVVLSQPSWWTLQRLLILVGILVAILMMTAIWITQLRRLVEQRTTQLQHETRERERAERQHALEAERTRIARDLHDDLGSSLTEISALANTGQRLQPGESNPAHLLHTIAGKARSLIAALDVIVWAVDPAENSLQSLADYLSGYADEYVSHAHISCRFKVPVAFPPVTLDGRVRHELFMSVKEALNNVVRHADATEVEFQMTVSDDALNIVIADNGKGFDPKIIREGYGLENLSGRLKRLGGRCLIESRPGSGTTIKISLPLPAPAGSGPDIASGGNTTNG